jgi:hypothetical protein
MSSIASFTLLAKSALTELQSAAVPKKTWFGKVKDGYLDFLRTKGTEAARYQYSGYVLGTLLPYLKQKRQIDLMHSEHDEIVAYLTKARSATHFFLTNRHRASYQSALAPDGFSQKELADYYNEFNQAKEDGAGLPMIEGIRAIHSSLSLLDDHSVILCLIG